MKQQQQQQQTANKVRDLARTQRTDERADLAARKRNVTITSVNSTLWENTGSPLTSRKTRWRHFTYHWDIVDGRKMRSCANDEMTTAMRMILRRRRYLEELGRRMIMMFADGRDSHDNVSSLIPYFSCSVCSARNFHPLSRSMRAVKVDKKITGRARQLLSLPGGPVSASLNPVESRRTSHHSVPSSR